MDVKIEVNGATPLPQRAPKGAGNAGGPGNVMKKPNNDGGGPAEKKPRFNNQGGGGGGPQQNRGGGGGGFGGKGFMNRNRNNRNQNQNQNRGNLQNQDQQNQPKANAADESTLEVKPNLADVAKDNAPNQQQIGNQQRNNPQNQNRGGQGGGGNRGNQGKFQDRPQQGGGGQGGGGGGGGSGGGGGGGGNQRGGPRGNRGDRGGPGGPGGGNKDFRNQDEFHINQRLRAVAGATYDLPPIETTQEVKFSGRNRLYIGNLTNDINEEELQQMFAPYGEIGEVFCNAEKNFTFLKVDYHANAERAKRELDGQMRKGRQLRIRFAPNATILKVSNLTPYVSNELLFKAFEVFGPVERAIVIADDRGKSTGEGIVEFVKKSSSNACIRYCNEKCFFLTSSLRPCVVEVYEPNDEIDGLPDKSLNRKTQEFQQERGIGPRVAEVNTFEHEYGSKWKQLYEMYKSKLDALKRELKVEEEKLEAQMEFARFEHETEMLRQELRKRESDNERKKIEWEMREKQVEEMRQRDEESMRRQTNEMQSRMMRQDEDMRRRQQENALFMQAQQLSSLLDQQEGFGGNTGNNFDNFGGNNNSPFEFRGNNGGGNMGGGNNNGPNGQEPFPFEFGGNQGGNQGNQRNNSGGNGNIPWERRRRF